MKIRSVSKLAAISPLDKLSLWAELANCKSSYIAEGLSDKVITAGGYRGYT